MYEIKRCIVKQFSISPLRCFCCSQTRRCRWCTCARSTGSLVGPGGQPVRGRDSAPRAAPPDAARGRSWGRPRCLARERWIVAWAARRGARRWLLCSGRAGGTAEAADWGRLWWVMTARRCLQRSSASSSTEGRQLKLSGLSDEDEDPSNRWYSKRWSVLYIFL